MSDDEPEKGIMASIGGALRRASAIGASLAEVLPIVTDARAVRNSFALARGLDDTLPYGGDLMEVNCKQELLL